MEGGVTISKEDFADTLYCWLSEHLAKQEVKAMAKQVDFKITGLLGIMMDKKLYSQFYSELFALNMYLIVFACQGVIEDVSKKDEVLDIFHRQVYVRNIKVTGTSYTRWMKAMQLIYDDYRKAMEEKSLLTPVLLVSGAFEKNIFGKPSMDPYVRFETGMRIGGIVRQLSQSLQEYTIE